MVKICPLKDYLLWKVVGERSRFISVEVGWSDRVVHIGTNAGFISIEPEADRRRRLAARGGRFTLHRKRSITNQLSSEFV